MRARARDLLQDLERFPEFGKGVVERRGREANDVRFPEIRHHAPCPQRQRDRLRLGVLERDVAAAPRRFARSADTKPEPGQLRIRGANDEVGHGDRFFADAIDPRCLDRLQRAVDRRHAQDRGRPDLQRRCAHPGKKFVGHLEHAFLVHAPPSREPGIDHAGLVEMAAVQVKSRNRAGAGVEPFVVTPAGEIRAPLIERVRENADGMREVEADGDVVLARGAADFFKVEELPRGVNDRGEKRHLQLGIFQRFDDPVFVEKTRVARRHDHDVFVRIESAEPKMTAQRITIGRKTMGIDQHLGAFRLRPVERGQELVQVDRHRVGDRDLVAGGADQPGDALGERFRHREPGRIAVEPAGDPAGLPLLKHAQQGALGVAREKTERVAVEVNSTLGRIKTVTELA